MPSNREKTLLHARLSNADDGLHLALRQRPTLVIQGVEEENHEVLDEI